MALYTNAYVREKLEKFEGLRVGYYGVTYLPKIHRYQTCKQKRVRLIMKIHLAKFWVSIVPGTIVGK